MRISDWSSDVCSSDLTQSAGYCLVTTALRDGRRVVSVIVGAASDAARTENSLKLLNWSFQNFDTIKLYDNTKPAVTARGWEGEVETVGLGSTTPTWVTVSRDTAEKSKPVAQYTHPPISPRSETNSIGEE